MISFQTLSHPGMQAKTRANATMPSAIIAGIQVAKSICTSFPFIIYLMPSREAMHVKIPTAARMRLVSSRRFLKYVTMIGSVKIARRCLSEIAKLDTIKLAVPIAASNLHATASTRRAMCA
jgi:hypothetical protein